MAAGYRATDRKIWEGIFAAAPPEWFEAPPSALMARAVRHLRDCRRVLDLGCGFGRWAKYIAQQTSSYVVGLDYALAGVALASRAAAPRTAFLAAEATSLPLRERAFDGFLAVLILESLRSPHAMAAVGELSRVVVPGSPGLLVFNPWPIPDGVADGNPTASCSGEHLDDTQVQQLLAAFEVRRWSIGENSLRCIEVSSPTARP